MEEGFAGAGADADADGMGVVGWMIEDEMDASTFTVARSARAEREPVTTPPRAKSRSQWAQAPLPFAVPRSRTWVRG